MHEHHGLRASRGRVAEVEPTRCGRPPAPQRSDLAVAQAAVLQTGLRNRCEPGDHRPASPDRVPCASGRRVRSRAGCRRDASRRQTPLARSADRSVRGPAQHEGVAERRGRVMHDLDGDAGGGEQPGRRSRKRLAGVHPESGGVRAPVRQGGGVGRRDHGAVERPCGQIGDRGARGVRARRVVPERAHERQHEPDGDAARHECDERMDAYRPLHLLGIGRRSDALKRGSPATRHGDGRAPTPRPAADRSVTGALRAPVGASRLDSVRVVHEPAGALGDVGGDRGEDLRHVARRGLVVEVARRRDALQRVVAGDQRELGVVARDGVGARVAVVAARAPGPGTRPGSGPSPPSAQLWFLFGPVSVVPILTHRKCV